jgi:hypothetical protein
MKLIYTKSTHSFHQFVITGSVKPKFGIIKTISNLILQFFKLSKKINKHRNVTISMHMALNLADLPITLTGRSYNPHYEKTSFHYLSPTSYAHNQLTASMVVKHWRIARLLRSVTQTMTHHKMASIFFHGNMCSQSS